MRNLSVVIDTNVFLVVVPSRSKYNWVFESIRHHRLDLLISTDIVLEYEEQFRLRDKVEVANQLLDILTLKKNVRPVTPYFNWNLISADADDNKFVDCAIAGNADHLITHDTDFDVLRTISFPKVVVVRLEEFEKILNSIRKRNKEKLPNLQRVCLRQLVNL